MHNNTGRAVILTATALAVVALAPVAATAMPDLSVFRNAVEISDLELGIQRGRYAGRGQIVYFGVEMNTEWRTASGESYRAGLQLSVDRHHGRYRPVINIVHRSEVEKPLATSSSAAPPTPATAPITSGGLDTVKGVGQVVQVTGDTNSVRNDINLSLRTVDSGAPSVAAATAPTPSGSATSTSDSGASAQSGSDPKQLGVSVVVPGQGIATQSITGLGGLRQNVQLTGDMNSVLNQLNLTAEFRAVSSPGMRHMRSSFQTMRGLPQAGMF